MGLARERMYSKKKGNMGASPANPDIFQSSSTGSSFCSYSLLPQLRSSCDCKVLNSNGEFWIVCIRIHHVVMKVLGIVCCDGVGQAIPTDDILFDEAGYLCLCQTCKRGSFYLFSKIINSDKNKTMLVGSLEPYRSRQWPTLSKLWDCYVPHRSRRLVDFICIDLVYDIFGHAWSSRFP